MLSPAPDIVGTGSDRPVLIHRDDPLDKYVSVSRVSAQSRALSYCAKGVLTEILSRPVDWQISADRMAEVSPTEGRTRVRAAFRELRAAGHLHRVVTRQGSRITTQLHTFRVATRNCGTPGCQDCADVQESVRQSDQGEHRVSAGGPDVQVSDCHEPARLTEPSPQSPTQSQELLADADASGPAPAGARPRSVGTGSSSSVPNLRVVPGGGSDGIEGMSQGGALAVIKRKLANREYDGSEDYRADLAEALRVDEADPTLTRMTGQGRPPHEIAGKLRQQGA